MENFYISTIIIPSVLFIISEILPWISKSKSIVHLIIDAVKFIIKVYYPNLTSETAPLLDDIENLNENTRHDSDTPVVPKQQNLDKIENILYELVSEFKACTHEFISNSKVIQQFQVSNAMIHPKEKYELTFIINYIKTNYLKRRFVIKNLKESNREILIDKGYIVDYDSHEDYFSISW